MAPGYTIAAPAHIPRGLIAGVARVDITPPPGFPTGGDGPAGNLSRGYWTRLYARAFFFMDAQGHALVLVSCDLFAIPGGLTAVAAREIAELAGKRGIAIPPEGIVIAATHTHQSPGNYLSSRTYNQYASKYPGFSRELFDFFVGRIAQAVNEAMNDAKETTLAVYTTAAGAPLQLNRSPNTFLLNWNAQLLMDRLHPPAAPLDCRPETETGEARNDWELPGCPRLRAADPAMTLLEIRRGGSTAGLMVFYAVHPTVLYPGAPVYSSDFVGYAMSKLEREAENAPVVGFFNGAEGDVVTRRGTRDVTDVARLGDLLASAISTLQASRPRPLENPLLDAKRAELGSGSDCGGARLAKAPVPGVAVLGGGEGDRTPLYGLGWSEGVRDVAREGQGPKKGGLDSPLVGFVKLTPILAGPETFPQAIPLHFLQIGSFKLGTFPAELSTATAMAIRQQLGAHGEFEIVGLANEYVSYVASPEEYAAQDYMGASTLWGPWEGQVFGCGMKALADAAQPVWKFPRSIPQREFLPGESPEKLPGGFRLGYGAVGERRVRPDEEMDRILRSGGAPDRGLPFVEWTEPAGDVFQETPGRRIGIEVLREGKWIPRRRGPVARPTPDDDRGPGFVTVMTRSPGESRSRSWAAIWLAPILDGPLPEQYRFHIVTWAGRSLCSEAFRVDPNPQTPPKAVPLATACVESAAR